MLDTAEIAGWLGVKGKTPKFYHTSDVCKRQLSPMVSGSEPEALKKGMKLCPDCEKANGTDR